MSRLRLIVVTVFALLAGAGASAQDVITVASTSGMAGDTVRLAVSVRDVAGTLLGSDANARIQGFVFRVTYDPAKVTSIVFDRAGVLLNRTPLYERTVTDSGSLAYIGSFDAISNPIPLTLNATAPGERIGTLEVTLASPLSPGTSVPLTFDPLRTALSNQAGTVIESRSNQKLSLISGSIMLGGAATTTTLASSPNPSNFGQNVTFTATITSLAGAIGGTITFYDGSSPIGFANVQGGQASLTTSELSPGTRAITATYEGDATHLPSESTVWSQTVNQPLSAPTAVTATATSTQSVNVSWTGVAGATSYEVRRSFNNSPFAAAGTSKTTNFTDGDRTANTTYRYVVKAIGPAGSSADSAQDHATTVAFTDDPLVPRMTKVKALHVTELHTAANALRASVGLTQFSFTSVSTGTTINRSQLMELRTAIGAARALLGLDMSVSDPTLTNQVIRAVHIQELRDAVK